MRLSVYKKNLEEIYKNHTYPKEKTKMEGKKEKENGHIEKDCFFTIVSKSD